MISRDDKQRIVGEVDKSTTRPLTDRQTNLLYARLNGVTQDQVRKALNAQASRDRFSFEHLLLELERAARTNKATDAKPHHSPNCEHGCEGEGWTPGPATQMRMMLDGETVRLGRCPGAAMTDAIWEGIRHHHEHWQPAAGTRDVAALLAEAKITHRLPPPKQGLQ